MLKDQCYLYRSFNPRMVTYETDGAGRDSYISCNNGGMIKVCAKEKKLITNAYSLNRNHQFFHLKKEAVITRYRNDGSGRDSYIR